MNFWLPLLIAVIAAVTAAATSYAFNRRLARITQKWEEKRHVARTCERFCDELMEHATLYWATNPSEEAKALAEKVMVSKALVFRFVNENFTHNQKVLSAVGQVMDVVAGGNFGGKAIDASVDRAALSADAIINLRLAIARDQRGEN